MNDPKIIVALDFADGNQALEFARKASPEQCRLKVGKELFTSCGPALVEQLISLGYDIFLDLKFHDIPNTVQKAASAAAKLGVWMLNVHALGGSAMMQAAREGVEIRAGRPRISVGREEVRAQSVDEDQYDAVRRTRRLGRGPAAGDGDLQESEQSDPARNPLQQGKTASRLARRAAPAHPVTSSCKAGLLRRVGPLTP